MTIKSEKNCLIQLLVVLIWSLFFISLSTLFVMANRIESNDNYWIYKTMVVICAVTVSASYGILVCRNTICIQSNNGDGSQKFVA